MPIHFCSTCGTKITYQVSKPEACPSCHTPIVDALKAMAQAAAAAVKVVKAATTITPDEDEIDDLPIGRSHSRVTTPKPILRKPASARRGPSAIVASEMPEEEEDNDEEHDEEGSEPYDHRRARRLARELAASIDPDTIHISNDEEGPVHFADWVAKPKS